MVREEHKKQSGRRETMGRLGAPRNIVPCDSPSAWWKGITQLLSVRFDQRGRVKRARDWKFRTPPTPPTPPHPPSRLSATWKQDKSLNVPVDYTATFALIFQRQQRGFAYMSPPKHSGPTYTGTQADLGIWVPVLFPTFAG